MLHDYLGFIGTMLWMFPWTVSCVATVHAPAPRLPAEARRIPLAQLDAEAAEALRPCSAVFVLPSGDLRSRQAAVRLRRVSTA